ncbi:phosphoribosylanthranilate isomerase [Acuticoccus sp. M5D2P5]|uniref:phosphoribosylanthranilate isomerase n=1 Tax=Acuticoccus kalidii TaxID=2910977 RepID=UPI001F426F82|nr:phosphoribosylanthranilate isomerase [Acuticoccus kalidii]MCF3934226.1 phosphoribosylanthranilate isomerase [Acuticoccus kalidii]
MRRTRVKICCIRSVDEAALAIAAGADALGFVGPMPTGVGPIPDDTTRAITPHVPAPISPWILTYESEPDAILAHAERCAVATVQIVQHVDPAVHDALERRAPWLRRVQVIHVEDRGAVDIMAAYGAGPHTFLLDSGRPSVDELGGTGRVHDWDVSAACVASVTTPVFLAGGLNPSNAADAIRKVRPFGLDVCTGLRPNTALDPARLTAFFDAIRAADDAVYGA